MSKDFDMALLLSGVLSGSTATQQRHVRKARIIQMAIQQRRQITNPWNWKCKHIRWFLNEHLKDHSHSTKYYYHLTLSLVWRRTDRDQNMLKNH
ncbi:hypothetical protein [Pseudomonas putida]|uniref:hypothetical protein n=1 Tax=Pseudomonas putida TaxID=303 RepID=UPI001E4F3A4E|nr:hypothetical protein [Pseudomonas putida]